MMLARASSSTFAGATTTLCKISPTASTSQRFLSTTAPVWKNRGKTKSAEQKAREKEQQLIRRDSARKSSKKDNTEMTLSEAVKLFQSVEVARPLNAYEVHVCTNVEAHQTNALRGRLALPNEARTKAERLLIFAEDGSEATSVVQSMLEANPALKANIMVGGAELINDVAQGTGAAAGLNFTKVLCTQGLLSQLSRTLARSLGPRGLMPSVKRGTVVESGEEMRTAIREAQGATDWRGDRNGVIRAAIGRINFTEEQLRANMASFMHAIVTKISLGLISGSTGTLAEPSSEVGKMSSSELQRAQSIIRQIHLSSTQGPAVLIPPTEVL